MQTSNTNINLNQNVSTNSTQRLTYSSAPKVRNTINELSKGEILKGEVINLRGSDIQILLSDGQTLKASFESTLPLFIGDHASFLVEESSVDSLVLKLMPNEEHSTTDATVDKALDEAFLPKNDKNITVVQELLKNGMSIDKNTILTMLRQSATFRNASIETLAIMNKYQIPMTDENTAQLEAYRNYEFRLLEQAKELTHTISNALVELPDDNALMEKFLSLFDDSTADTQENSELFNTTNNSNQDSEVMSLQQNSNESFELNSKEEIPKQLNPSSVDTANTSNVNNSFEKVKQESLQPKNQILHSEVLHENTELDSSTKLTTVKEQTPDIIKQDSLLETILKNEFTLPLRKLTEPESISKFYEKLEHDLDKIHSFFKENSQLITKEQKDTILSQTNNVKDNIDFMKTLNQLFGYVQLPMKLPNRNVHSELFVYTNKKKLQEGNQQVSVLLHLDMTHLGPIDFHLSLMNQHVTAKIGIENPQSMTLIEQHLPELANALEAKGYSMTYEMERLEKETKVIRDAFESNSSDLLMRRYSFDLRA